MNDTIHALLLGAMQYSTLTEVLTAASAIYMLFAGENALPPWHELYTPTKHNRKEAY